MGLALRNQVRRVSIPLAVLFSVIFTSLFVLFLVEFNGTSIGEAFHAAVNNLFLNNTALHYWIGFCVICILLSIYLYPAYLVHMNTVCGREITKALAHRASKSLQFLPFSLFLIFESLSVILFLLHVLPEMREFDILSIALPLLEYISIGFMISILVLLYIRNLFFPVKKAINGIVGMPKRSSFFGLIMAIIASLILFIFFQLLGVSFQFIKFTQPVEPNHLLNPNNMSSFDATHFDLNNFNANGFLQVIALRIGLILFLTMYILVQIKFMIMRPLNTITKGLLRLNSSQDAQVNTIEIINNDEFGQVFGGLNALIEKKQRELASTQGQFDSIVSNAADPIIVYDHDYKIQTANPAAEKYFGYEPGTLVGEDVTCLFPTDLSPGRRLTRYEVNSKDGRNLKFEAHIDDCGGDDEPTYTLIIRDISHQLEVEESLKRAKVGAEKANALKSEFLANMSHELRTPLNAVLGFTQILSNDKNLTQNQQDKLAVIGRSGEHLLGLINDILDISKIEAGKMELQNSDFDLHSLVKDMGRMFELKTKSKNLTLYVELIGDPPQFVEGDLGKIRQVLINLIGNAVKFTEEGGIGLTVGRDEGDHGKFITFAVTDSGRGIPQADIELIMQPFVQSSNTDHEGGTGLGLAISSRYIEMMGGKLSIQSKLGEGSVFTFTIPLVEGKMVEDEEGIDAVPIAVKEGREILVLVVDDKEPNRLILKEMLEHVGFIVIEAENGKIAYERAKAEKPELIFMDIKMPVLDGYGSIELIRKDVETSQIKVFALTASAFKHDEERIFSSGFTGFLAKPFKQTSLFNLIAQKGGIALEYEHGLVNSKPIIIDWNTIEVNKEWQGKFDDALGINDFGAIEQLALELRDLDARKALQGLAKSFNEDALQKAREEWKVA